MSLFKRVGLALCLLLALPAVALPPAAPAAASSRPAKGPW